MGEIVKMSDQAKVVKGELCLSSAATYDLFGISPQTLSEWVEKGMPRVQRGWYPLKRMLQWRGVIKSGDASDKVIDLQQRKLEVEIALKEAQTDLAVIKTDIANGKYLERELVVEEYRRFFVILKRAILAIPKRAAGVIAAYIEPVEARRIEKELTEMVKKALDSFVNSGIVEAPPGMGD